MTDFVPQPLEFENLSCDEVILQDTRQLAQERFSCGTVETPRETIPD